MKQKINRVGYAFQNFFFQFESLYQLGLMRLVVSTALLGIYIWRQFVVDFYFSNKTGIVLEKQAMSLLPEIYRSLVPLFFWPDALTPWVHGFLLFLLLGLVLGIGGRLWTLLTWCLSLAFIQRNYFVAYGADLIGTVWLFYLSWTRHNKYFSVLNLLHPERIKNIQCDMFSSAGARLIQIQISVIYCFTGLHKLKGASWWEGSALWLALGNRQYAISDFTWFSHWPLMVAMMGYMTLIFEIYFPLFVWNPKTKPYVLMAGVFFHTGVALTMGIWSFAGVMIGAYALFFKEEQWRQSPLKYLFFRRTPNRLSSSSPMPIKGNL